ncbi:MAG: OmpH family outer membrane protein [Sphingobacteriaceae bacterium]|nr:OmpH family outer membrane protein [Cytophagaceae bacterium]
MKNASLALNVVLLVAVAVLYFLHFSSRTGSVSTADSTGTVGSKPLVYVNSDSLLTQYDFYKDAKKAFEQKRAQLDLDLNTRGTMLQRKIQQFQQQGPGMIAAEAQAKQMMLQKEGAEFEQYRQKAANDLGEDEAKKNEELYNNISTYIQKYNRENGYHFVLGYSKGGGILYANPDFDVTQKIIAGLNKEYKDSQAKAAPATEKK